jgi:hypothetical protein
MEVWRLWINHFLTFLVILAASGKLVDRFCFAYFLPLSFLYDPPALIFLVAVIACGSLDSKVAAQQCTTLSRSFSIDVCQQ